MNKRVKLSGNIAYIIGAALLIAAVVTNLVPPRVASAHHPAVSGEFICQDDGSYLVTWTISNWSGTTLPMTITAINRSIGVPVGTVVPTSVQGTETFPGTTVAELTLTVSGSWSNGATGTTTSGKVKLKGDCAAPPPPPPPDYQLNISHIYCYEGENEELAGLVEVHFVLLNVPDGITPGTLTYTYGSIAPGAHTGNVWHYFDYIPGGVINILNATVDVGGVEVTLHNPGTYAGTYDCGTPEEATASIYTGFCTYTPGAGSLTPVTITLNGASLTIDGVTYTSSTTIDLEPGFYNFTWTALPGYTGSGSGQLYVGDCTPEEGTAEFSLGICTWTELDGSLTQVAITLSNASFTIDSTTYSASTTIYLAPESYEYSWEADEGYQGSGNGTIVIGDCTPDDASAQVEIGICSWDEQTGSLTPVIITLVGASFTIDGSTYTGSVIVYLEPDSYDYSWTALEGYKGSGSGTVVVGDCTPGTATASVTTGICTWDVEEGSMTPVVIELNGASLTIDDVTYEESTSFNLPPDSYDYTWEALDGFIGSGEGTLVIGECPPPPVPTASIICYTLEFSSFRVNIGNSGPAAGVIGYSTNLDATIISLGELESGEEVEILVPLGPTTLYVYPEEGGGWGTPIELALDITRIPVCEEDPMGLTSFCSYIDLSQPHGWTVTNANPFAVQFTWVYGALSSSGPIALGVGGEYTFTTSDQPGAEMQIFVDGKLLASSTPISCPEFIELGLVGICSNNPETTHGWRATNQNAFEVSAEWRVNGSALTGLLTLPADSSVLFTTPVTEGNIAMLYYGGLFQDDASAARDCTPPEPPPPGPPPGPPPEPPTPHSSEEPVLIPVTGVADDLAGLMPAGMFSLGLGFFGLGTILHGVSRRKKIDN